MQQESWRQRLARGAYVAALRLLTPLYLLRLWRRGAREPLYRRHVAERLGYGPAAPQGAVWVHAVSLGETKAAAALLAALRTERPGLRLLLTHATATGREAGRELLQPGDLQVWLPYDTPGAVRRFLRRHRPQLGVLMETEIWPSLLREAERQGLPMVLANARLSARSLRKGLRFQALLGPAAARLRMALAQSDSDAQRLRQAGVAQVEVMGNLKYELRPDESLLQRGRAWREALRRRGDARPVLLAAVTREGEEALLLKALAAWPTRQARPLLLLVPRHPQRFADVAALVEAAGLRLARRSAWLDEPVDSAWGAEVWLGDSMREMALYYGMADLALLGGSFAPLGGQNLIEAAACACPVLMGPHTFNFAQAASLAEEAGAARRTGSMESALVEAAGLLGEPQALRSMAAQASRFAAAHRGAAQRMARALCALMDEAR